MSSQDFIDDDFVEEIPEDDAKLPDEGEDFPPVEERAKSDEELERERIDRKKQKSRERYQTLVDQRRDADQRAEQEYQARLQRERELLEAYDEIQKLRQTHQAASVESLEAQRARIRQERFALSDQVALGDADAQKKAWDLDDKLSELNTELAFAKRGNYKQPESKPEPPRQPPRSDPGNSPAAQEWASRNRWYHQDQKAQQATDAIMRKMIDEGYEFGERSFFKTLDERLAKIPAREMPPTSGETRGFDSPRNDGRLQDGDKDIMASIGMDWRNPKHRKEFLESQRLRDQ